MMKTMIAENGVTFKELEKNIYKWSYCSGMGQAELNMNCKKC